MARPTDKSPETAINELARVLYERLERLAGTGDYVEWERLPSWERALHRHGVKAVLGETELLRSILPLADDDVIERRVEKRE